jgi:hypothetical protein
MSQSSEPVIPIGSPSFVRVSRWGFPELVLIFEIVDWSIPVLLANSRYDRHPDRDFTKSVIFIHLFIALLMNCFNTLIS